MPPSIDDQVIDFYQALFERLFSEPFRSRIDQRLRRNDVIRQVQAAADAASQSLTRFFLNEQLTERQVLGILAGFAGMADRLDIGDVSNPYVTPEKVVDKLLPDLPSPQKARKGEHDALYRVALHSVVQVLMLVGPVMAEWQKLNFSSTFELPRRVVGRLNRISEQMAALGRSGEAAADERYELTYRDYLLQRFYRVEAGTVRMTTNLDIDLRELFVMPKTRLKPLSQERIGGQRSGPARLMDLAAARKFFGHSGKGEEGDLSEQQQKEEIWTALEQVKRYSRNVILGAPGSGKSTFLEWLQVQLASVEEELILAGEQAIPLLLRVRQLDADNLPNGAALIEKATNSRDRAALMPPGWIDRQMKSGRVLFMLDGLDETEPELRDESVLPWVNEICQEYPDCQYLVSSRPVGYSPGTLRELEFIECDLMDFEEPQVGEYTRHWCTAVRLARNEPEKEARREGRADGKRIVDGFHDHPYIRDLARNPLMLSAVCLVHYFEGGQLPKDRPVLYKLCVEGLMHNWDQRRGIHSEFTFEEKLRTCRELALAMQTDDRAEYEKDRVQAIFAEVLNDVKRAEQLLEHIRYRTGLLLERRPDVFAFAHLTFQEYLAARAVNEGNHLRVTPERLSREHDDGRWQEVIPLYSGLAPTPAARDMIERIVGQDDTLSLSAVLAEAYLSCGAELAQDAGFRQRVLERIAVAPGLRNSLKRFPTSEVVSIANRCVGTTKSTECLSESYQFLVLSPWLVDVALLAKRLQNWRAMSPIQVDEVFFLLHRVGADELLAELATWTEIYEAQGSFLSLYAFYGSQAEAAFFALYLRQLDCWESSPGFEAALLAILRTLVKLKNIHSPLRTGDWLFEAIDGLFGKTWLPHDSAASKALASAVRRFAKCLAGLGTENPTAAKQRDNAADILNAWANSIEAPVKDEEDPRPASGRMRSSKPQSRRGAKKRGV